MHLLLPFENTIMKNTLRQKMNKVTTETPTKDVMVTTKIKNEVHQQRSKAFFKH